LAKELSFDYLTGSTLYAARFQLDGNVFVTSGLTDEVWATADLYDVEMTEDGIGGHYVGNFDTSENITEGVYQVTVYLQTGGSPANSDTAIGRGQMSWDGTAELNFFTIDNSINILTATGSKVLNIFGPGE
jgi:hypothetical protein